MKKITTFFALLFCFTLLATAQNVLTTEVIVKLEKEVQPAVFLKNFNAAEKSLGTVRYKKVIPFSPNIHVFTYESDKCDGDTAVEFLREQDGAAVVALGTVEAEERGRFPDDPRYEVQWNLDRIEIDEVWEVTTGGQTADGREIVTAVIDGGFDLTHPEFENSIWLNQAEIPNNGIDDDENGYTDDLHGYNFQDDSWIHTSIAAHGTQVAGFLGAQGNNGQGMSGTSWDSKMMLFQGKAINQILSAYYYVYDQRKRYNETDGAEGAFVTVINASIGIPDPCNTGAGQMWNEAMDSVGTVGVLTAGATLNANFDVDAGGDIPTGCESDFVISVTNTSINDVKVDGAGFGRNTIDLGAPGGQTNATGTYTTLPDSTFNDNWGGCSAATPQVAGVVALMYALPCESISERALTHPAETALLMKRSIIEGAEPNNSLQNITVSGGRLNAFRAMSWWQSYCANPRSEMIDVEQYLAENGRRTRILNMYPNPTNSTVTVEYSIGNFRAFEVRVYDALGRLVQIVKDEAVAFQPLRFELDTEDWAEGIYYVSIVNGLDTEASLLSVVR